MKVTAKFLAIPPATLDDSRFEVDVPAGTTAGGLIALLAQEYPVLRAFTRFLSVSVNRVYVGLQAELHEGDEVVYSPPVGGG
ncbi:MAG TPA: MoaD/ThiS family protein [Anaerolineae bacterium]|nr:MoaD/ThiS family protein [Anaerolineae bacterium]